MPMTVEKAKMEVKSAPAVNGSHDHVPKSGIPSIKHIVRTPSGVRRSGACARGVWRKSSASITEYINQHAKIAAYAFNVVSIYLLE